MIPNNLLKLYDVADRIGEENVLIQLAEECSELSQAAIKRVRSNRGLTPVDRNTAYKNLIEEYADVVVCMQALVYTLNSEGNTADTILYQIMKSKIDRWYQRIFGKKKYES